MEEKEMTYEEMTAELNEIVTELQQKITSLDELSTKVKRAVHLIHSCTDRLKQTEENLNEVLEF